MLVIKQSQLVQLLKRTHKVQLSSFNLCYGDINNANITELITDMFPH